MKRFSVVLAALLVFAACAVAQPSLPIIQGPVTLQLMVLVDPAVNPVLAATTGPDVLIAEFFFTVAGGKSVSLLVKVTSEAPDGSRKVQSAEFTTTADSPYPSMISFWYPRGNTLTSVSFAEIKPLAAFALRQ